MAGSVLNMVRMCRYWVVLLVLPLCVLTETMDEEDDSAQNEDETLSLRPLLPTTNVTKKVVSISQPVTLNCGRQGVDLAESTVVWFFKSCGLGSSSRPCDLSKDVDGKKMCSTREGDPCRPKLVLDKPQPGLYRCYKTGQKSGYIMTATLVNTYQLEIIERKLEPEFLEVPEDVEAFAGSSALFMCRIRSHLPLHVRWYRQVIKSPQAIQYENNYYQGLNSSITVKNGDIYLSKMKFKMLTLNDGGVYACGAVNEAGIQYKDARLTVTAVPQLGPPRPPAGPWKMIFMGSAVGFLVFLMMCICCIRFAGPSCSCRRSKRNEPIHGVPRRRHPPKPMRVPEPETSDYEHVTL